MSLNLRLIKAPMVAAIATTFFIFSPMVSSAKECDGSEVHCVRFAIVQPKFMKITTNGNGKTQMIVRCVGKNETIAVSQDAVKSGQIHVGEKIKVTYNQCADGKCAESFLMGSDVFKVERGSNGTYTSTPREFGMIGNPVYGVNCVPSPNLVTT